MPKVTALCYLSSIIFYGMGYLKTWVINNAVTEPMNTYDFTINVSLATGYFVLAIFFAITGSLVFYVKYHRDQKNIKLKVIKIPQLTKPEYDLDLYRRMSS